VVYGDMRQTCALSLTGECRWGCCSRQRTNKLCLSCRCWKQLLKDIVLNLNSDI